MSGLPRNDGVHSGRTSRATCAGMNSTLQNAGYVTHMGLRESPLGSVPAHV